MANTQTNITCIRAAHPDEAELLTLVALRSKAHWGYDQAFMALCQQELTVNPDRIRKQPTYVLEQGDRLLGFYMLDRNAAPTSELDFLFVLPEAIGQGFGRQLLLHAIETARTAGDGVLLIQSDPQAEHFYRRFGARLLRYTPSASIPGRVLPLLQLDL